MAFSTAVLLYSVMLRVQVFQMVDLDRSRGRAEAPGTLPCRGLWFVCCVAALPYAETFQGFTVALRHDAIGFGQGVEVRANLIHDVLLLSGEKQNGAD